MALAEVQRPERDETIHCDGGASPACAGMARRRVVVTGIGVVTPFGHDVEGFWQALLAGGADAPICGSVLAGWAHLRVLTQHPEPAQASRPFDKDRDGLVLSEGAGMLVLEEEAFGASIGPLDARSLVTVRDAVNAISRSLQPGAAVYPAA